MQRSCLLCKGRKMVVFSCNCRHLHKIVYRILHGLQESMLEGLRVCTYLPRQTCIKISAFSLFNPSPPFSLARTRVWSVTAVIGRSAHVLKYMHQNELLKFHGVYIDLVLWCSKHTDGICHHRDFSHFLSLSTSFPSTPPLSSRPVRKL